MQKIRDQVQGTSYNTRNPQVHYIHAYTQVANELLQYHRVCSVQHLKEVEEIPRALIQQHNIDRYMLDTTVYYRWLQPLVPIQFFL